MYGLKEKHIKAINSVFSKYPQIEKAILYGSRAKGNYRTGSDIDLTLVGDNLDLTTLFKIETELDDLLLPYKMDLSILHKIENPDLIDHIKRVGITFYLSAVIQADEKMMSEVTEKKLSDIGCEFISGYGFKNSDYTNKGIPLIKTGNIQNKVVSIIKDGTSVSESIINKKIKQVFLTDKDVLIAMTGQGSVGRVGRLKLKKGQKALLNQRVGKFICDEQNINIDYLYYILSSDKYQDYLFNTGSRSGQPNLTPSLILQTEIPWFEYNTQKQIAEILTSLDDKIDLLHRQNKTLKAMAETLFREWFVERDKEGWEEVRVGDFVKTNIKSINKEYQYSTIKYLDTGSLTDGKIESLQELEINNAPGRAKRLVKHNDVLISTVRPNQRHFGIIKNPPDNLVVSTGFCVISCDEIDPYFIYALLTTNDMTAYLHSIAEGSTSTYPSLKPSDIEAISFSMPPVEKLNQFSEFALNNWNKIDYNQTQIQTLEKLRDTLLPKLMSGAIKVVKNE